MTPTPPRSLPQPRIAAPARQSKLCSHTSKVVGLGLNKPTPAWWWTRPKQNHTSQVVKQAQTRHTQLVTEICMQMGCTSLSHTRNATGKSQHKTDLQGLEENTPPDSPTTSKGFQLME